MQYDQQLPRRTYLLPALLSGIFSAFYIAIDNFILHNPLRRASDPLAGTLAYLLVGYWVALLTSVLYAKLFGKRLDSGYSGITRGGWALQKLALSSGIFASLSALFMLWAQSLYDLSVILPLASISIFYLILYDVMRRLISIREIIPATLVILLGSGATSVARLDVFEISLAALLLVLVMGQGSIAISEISSQMGVRMTDSVNFHFWRFFWSTVTSTLMIGFIVYATDRANIIVEIYSTGLLPAFSLIVLSMFFVYLAQVLVLRARKDGPISEVRMLTSIRVMLGVPLTLIVSTVVPGAFGPIPSDPRVWVVRSIGALLVLIGVVMLCRKKAEVAETAASSGAP